jgi:outer membrane receptor protein involved in Fe transport
MSVSSVFLKSGASRYAILGAALAFTVIGSAVAQDQPAPAPADQPAAAAPAPGVEEIVVTGSRIRTSDVTAAAPLTVVTAEQIQRSSVVTMEDLVRKIPALDNNGGGVGSSINNGSYGAASASLHNLGYTRTLILMDSKRLPYTDFGASADAVDLNSIPASLIDHVEVLRDSASSIYGADAIGGVINFITKKNFEGFDTGVSYGSTDKDDSRNYGAYATLGANFERGNVVISASYDHRDPILQINRDWASNEFIGTDNVGGGPISSAVPGLRGSFETGPYAGQGVYFYGPTNKFVLLTNPNLAKYLRPDVFQIAPGTLRFNLTYHPDLTVGLERKQFNLAGHYDLTDDVQFVMDGFFTDRTSQQALNPDPLGSIYTTLKYPDGFFEIPALLPDGTKNPGNPFGRNFDVARTRPFEGGLRAQTDDVQTYRIHAGFEGTIADTYNWDAGYAYGKSSSVDAQGGTANFTHLQQLAGDLPCGADAGAGCSPANFFGTNSLTAAQTKYLYYTSVRNTEETQQYAYASISGPVYQLPAGDMKFAAGLEARSETLVDRPDSTSSNGDSDFDALPGQGSDTSYSAYAEVKAPLLKDLPFAKSLDLDTSARYDYYTLFGRSLTWKVGLDYAIDDDVRLRGSRSTGFRAPQVKELYGGGFESAESGVDPCDPSSVPSYAGSPACNAALKAAGVDPKTFVSGLTGQITAVTGGNRSLKPEVSSSWTMGTVLTPSFIPNLSIALDYYDIHIRNTIGTIGAQSIVNDCYGPLGTYCNLISPRQIGSGNLVLVSDSELNVGAETTNGLDLDIAYGFDAADIGIPTEGHIQLSAFTEYLLSDDITDQNGNLTQQAGAFNFSVFAEPRWKSNLTAVYTQDNWSFGWTERYYGGVHILGAASDGFGDHAAGIFYSDINASYNFDNVTVNVGMDNVFDKDPPFLQDGAVNTNTNANYDFIGRYLYMKVSAKFGAGNAAPEEKAAYVPPAPAPVMASVPHSYLVFFDFNKSDLTSQAVGIVDTAAKNAGPAHVTQLTVTGQTETVGSDAYNMRLSRRRAESVAAQLEKDGIASSEIEIVAKGKRDLLVPTADGVKEPQNRRVQIVYSGGPTS